MFFNQPVMLASLLCFYGRIIAISFLLYAGVLEFVLFFLMLLLILSYYSPTATYHERSFLHEPSDIRKSVHSHNSSSKLREVHKGASVAVDSGSSALPHSKAVTLAWPSRQWITLYNAKLLS